MRIADTPGRWFERLADPYGVKAMCDHGARAFAAGDCDVVRFECMPSEVAEIRRYMAEKHPAVPYGFG